MSGEKVYFFPYHYGQEAESYTFYRVPKILFTAEVFDRMDAERTPVPVPVPEGKGIYPGDGAAALRYGEREVRMHAGRSR